VEGCDEVALRVLLVEVEWLLPVECPVEWRVVEWCDVDEDEWLLLFDPEWLLLLLPPFGPAKARTGSRSARKGRIFIARSRHGL
jgi:hypothetical protein